MPLALLWRRQDEESPSDPDSPGPTDGTGETTTSPPPDDEPTTPPSEPTTTPTSTRTTSSTPTSTRTTSTHTSTTTTQPPPPPPSPSPTSSSTTTTNESVTTSLTSSDSSSSPASAPAGPAFPSGNTKTVDPTNNFVDPNDISTGLNSDVLTLPTQSTISSPAEQGRSSNSKALPIVLPCLLIPIALAAVLVMIIRRRRQQHSQMLDDFTHRSTFYGGPTTGGGDNYSGKEIMMTAGSSSNIARSPSLASSRYHDAYGPNSPSGAGNMDHTMPPMVHNPNFLSAGNPGFAVAAAPIRAHQHTRSGSDDLDIKCAGRVESSASFGALYDQYGSSGTPGQTQAANGDVASTLAYDQSSVAAPMPDHPYASAQAPVYPSAYQHGYQQQAQYPHYDAYESQQYTQYPVYSQQQQQQQQQAQYQYQDQYSVYSQQQYPAQQYQPQQYEQQYATSTSPISPLSPPGPTAPLVASIHSRTVTSPPPQLDLPAFSYDFNNVSNSASPISAVFKSDDPFADPGSAGAVAAAAKVPTAGDFPAPPTRVSMERRAARTKSVEQRLMMALDDTQRATA